MSLFTVVIENRPEASRNVVTPRVFDNEERAFNHVLGFAIEMVEVCWDDLEGLKEILPDSIFDVFKNETDAEIIRKIVQSLDLDIQLTFVDSLFKYLDDEQTVAYYRIEEQVLDNDSGLITLSDCLIRDWRFSELNDDDIPNDCKDYYRLTVEQSQTTGQVYIKVYPNVIDELGVDVSENGLGICVEIKDGLPALSVGINPNDLDVSIQSDLNSMLSIRNDLTGSVMSMQLGDGDWLNTTRRAIADLAYSNQIWGIENFSEDAGAVFDGREYSRTFYQEREDCDETASYRFSCVFAGKGLDYDCSYTIVK